MAGEVWIGSVGDWSELSIQWPFLHDCGDHPARVLRSEDRRLGYARFLDAAGDGTTDRGRNFAPQESQAGVVGCDRADSARHEPEECGGAASGGTTPVAGKPCGGHDAAGNRALGEADPASDAWRRGCLPAAGNLP